MGKKPVIGLAGLFLASAVLSGCQRNQACNSGVCGDNGHTAAGPGWNTGMASQKAVVGQPGGAMAAGSTATTPGMTGTTPGFKAVGTPGMGGSSMTTVPGAGGMSGTRTIPSTGSLGGHSGSMGSPTGSSMGGSSGLSGTRTIPSTGLNPPSTSGGRVIPPSAPINSGIPSGGSSLAPSTITVPGGTVPLPDNPVPTDGTSSQSNHSGSALTPAAAVAPPNGLEAMPVQTLPDGK